MRTLHQRTYVVVLAAALAAGTAACGSSPAPDPLKSLSSAAIAARAVAGTQAAGSVHVTGKGKGGGKSLTFDLTLSNGTGNSSGTGGKGCAGTVTESGTGTFKLIELGPSMWVQPNTAFYKSAAARGAVVPLRALSGKYLTETPGKSGLGSFGSLCQLNPLLTAFKSAAATFTKGTVTTIAGTRVLRLSGGAASLYVTDTATPELVKIDAPGTALYYFDRYNAPAPVSAPSAGQVADASRYGF